MNPLIARDFVEKTGEAISPEALPGSVRERYQLPSPKTNSAPQLKIFKPTGASDNLIGWCKQPFWVVATKGGRPNEWIKANLILFRESSIVLFSSIVTSTASDHALEYAACTLRISEIQYEDILFIHLTQHLPGEVPIAEVF